MDREVLLHRYKGYVKGCGSKCLVTIAVCFVLLYLALLGLRWALQQAEASVVPGLNM